MLHLEQEIFFKQAKELIRTHEDGYYIFSFINVNNFTLIHEQYGGETSDMLLTHITTCLAACAEQVGGICGHIIADQFVILYPQSCVGQPVLKEFYDKAINPPCMEKKIGIRIGNYIVADRQEDITTIYYRARVAAESVRGSYEKKVAFYNEELRSRLLRRQQIVFDMDDALEKEQFELWIQPQYNHATGALIGGEVLVRWNKDGQYISPADFIEIFEQNGFIYPMDRYVWERACMLLQRWRTEGRTMLPLSVNVSRCDLQHADVVEKLCGLLQQYEIPIDLLRLEITETAFSGTQKEILERVRELVRLGFTVEIDDFGSGYSSLNTLKDVPAAILKLDMRFFENSENEERAGNIIESVVHMARWLNMGVIAEGVEHKYQADYLVSIGCYDIQGYYYAKPMPIADYEQRLDSERTEAVRNDVKFVEHFDNMEFWNPKSIDTLVFNSYVGGAYVFEYANGETDVLRVNDQYRSQFRGIIPEGTPLGRCGICNYLAPQERARFFETVERAIQNRREESCDIEVSAAGRTEYLQLRMRVIAKADERYLLYAVITNHTQQRMAQQTEQNLTRQMQAILQNIQDGVIAIVFHDKEIIEMLFINEAFYKMYGYTQEQFRQEVDSINDVIHPDARAMVKAHLMEVLAQRKTATCEYRCLKRDGSVFWVQMRNSPFTLEGVSGSVLLGVARDITAQKQARAKLTQLSEEAQREIAHCSPRAQQLLSEVREEIDQLL